MVQKLEETVLGPGFSNILDLLLESTSNVLQRIFLNLVALGNMAG